MVLKNHEPQMNADERRLNALFLDIIEAAFEKERECVLNLWRVGGKDKNQSGIKRRLLTTKDDKSHATNLRLSAFICGLKNSQKTKQPDLTLKLENLRLLFDYQISENKKVHLQPFLR